MYHSSTPDFSEVYPRRRRIPGAENSRGVRGPWEEARRVPRVTGSQAEPQEMRLETEDGAPWLFAWFLGIFS